MNSLEWDNDCLKYKDDTIDDTENMGQDERLEIWCYNEIFKMLSILILGKHLNYFLAI